MIRSPLSTHTKKGAGLMINKKENTLDQFSKGLPCLPLDGQTNTALSLLVLTCFLQQRRSIITRKSLIRSTTIPMSTKPVKTLLAKQDAVLQLIQQALKSGIKADYFLMNTWFTTESMISSICPYL